MLVYQFKLLVSKVSPILYSFFFIISFFLENMVSSFFLCFQVILCFHVFFFFKNISSVELISGSITIIE